jgi:eukaryotic-like serine/threonine-protein kinase
MNRNTSAAQQSLQRFASTHPWVTARSTEIQKTINDAQIAAESNDGQTALNLAASIPDLQFPVPLFSNGRSHLLINDSAAAEVEFRRASFATRGLVSNLAFIRLRFPAIEILSHYYLGQVYERTGKRDQAINEYQEFLSRFESSHTRLPQVAEARTILKRLME